METDFKYFILYTQFEVQMEVRKVERGLQDVLMGDYGKNKSRKLEHWM